MITYTISQENEIPDYSVLSSFTELSFDLPNSMMDLSHTTFLKYNSPRTLINHPEVSPDLPNQEGMHNKSLPQALLPQEPYRFQQSTIINQHQPPLRPQPHLPRTPKHQPTSRYTTNKQARRHSSLNTHARRENTKKPRRRRGLSHALSLVSCSRERAASYTRALSTIQSGTGGESENSVESLNARGSRLGSR